MVEIPHTLEKHSQFWTLTGEAHFLHEVPGFETDVDVLLVELHLRLLVVNLKQLPGRQPLPISIFQKERKVGGKQDDRLGKHQVHRDGSFFKELDELQEQIPCIDDEHVVEAHMNVVFQEDVDHS